MKVQFTVSTIAKRTGIDRRTVERALLDVDPAETATRGGKRVQLFDRDDAIEALASSGVPRESIARLAPFGGSLTRVVAWNVLVRYLELLQFALAVGAVETADEKGIPRQHAEIMFACAGSLAAQTADYILANFTAQVADESGFAETEALITGFKVPARDAAEGEFLERITLGDEFERLARRVMDRAA